MIQLLFWPALCVTAIIAYFWFEKHAPAPILGRRLAMGVASISYIIFFFVQIDDIELISAMILVATAFSALGDQLLVRRGSANQLAFGIIAFAFAHLFYAAAISSFVVLPANLLWSALAALLFVSTVLLSIWRYFEGLFRYLSAIYLIALSLNITFCMGVAIEREQEALLFGIILFAFSDLLAAAERFVENRKSLRYVSLPCYLSGQFLILYGCAQLLLSAN